MLTALLLCVTWSNIIFICLFADMEAPIDFHMMIASRSSTPVDFPIGVDALNESQSMSNINLPTLHALLEDETAMDGTLELDLGDVDVMVTNDQSSPLPDIMFSPSTLDGIMMEFEDNSGESFPVDFITPPDAFITTTPISPFISTMDYTPTNLYKRPTTPVPESPRLEGIEKLIPSAPFSGFTISRVPYEVRFNTINYNIKS